MKKQSILSIPLTMFLFTTMNHSHSSAEIFNYPCVRGSGNAISDNRPVSNFSSVIVSTAGSLIVQQGEIESLKITADDNLLRLLTSTVSNGQLILDVKGKCISPKSNITYRVTVKNLSAVKVIGDVDVDLRNINTDQLAISVDGNSDSFTASGRADLLKISVSGNLEFFNGTNLSSKSAKVNISGDASVVTKVADNLDVKISGDGSVKFIGNPTITKQITGDGSVQRR